MAIAVDVLNKQLKSYKSQVDSLLIFILILLYYMMHYKKKKKKSDQIHFLNICQPV